MTDYSELVKALRCCISKNPPETCVGCTYNIGNNECAVRMMMLDAAAAIEALEARLGEAENSVERWKDMYLTKHEPKRGKKYPMRCPNCSTVVGVMEVQE